MPKFLIKASYNAEGARGLLKEGGTGRVEAVKKLAQSLGGRIESWRGQPRFSAAAAHI